MFIKYSNDNISGIYAEGESKWMFFIIIGQYKKQILQVPQKIKLIVGARQTGKTTLLNNLIEIGLQCI